MKTKRIQRVLEPLTLFEPHSDHPSVRNSSWEIFNLPQRHIFYPLHSFKEKIIVSDMNFNVPSLAVPAILGYQGLKIKDIQERSRTSIKIVKTNEIYGSEGSDYFIDNNLTRDLFWGGSGIDTIDFSGTDYGIAVDLLKKIYTWELI